ncbi:MAG: helix-turn-helix transcriptional regulator [Acidimicrobiales bacterium]
MPTPEEYVGASIRRLRQAHGWSQEQLARAMSDAGFKWIQTTVAKTEAAERPIRLGEMIGLARLFGVEAHEMFEPPSDTGDAQADVIRRNHELAQLEAEERSLQGRLKGVQDEFAEVRARMEQAKANLREAENRYAEMDSYTRELPRSRM